MGLKPRIFTCSRRARRILVVLLSPNVPTYEFRCPKGHDFERFYKTISTAPSEVECPECGATASRQLSAGAGLLFKGSGFYLTDYGKNAHRGQTSGKASDAGADKPADTKTDKKPDTRADTKSDTKADTKAVTKADARPAAESKPKPKPKAE